ncbi:hypothetical protein FBZ84_101177 [Azospirillum baldaniorum]|uniref:DUF2184 domain-containing protein n=1 Tax=Azospirillum baldaniorum TaxID=1064539 RepID=UPI0011AA760D|nr:DUF2184 domain-containing protein [Azospirillum baldaniorum]TWA71911.1 hypothetical protein FBZ84_101177 [Azospirillum baldaniorum]
MPRFATREEARAAFAQDQARLESYGIYVPATAYLSEDVRANYTLAMDAQPGLTTDPNGGVPAMLTTMIDPQVYEVFFSPNKGAAILGEVRKGTWVDQTAMFPVTENTGEVSAYGDYSANGVTGVNVNFPQRQSFLFQTNVEVGDLELERLGLARVNAVAAKDKSAAVMLDRFANVTYHFGVAGLENYGLLNDPNLSAALTPATKAAGGTKWIVNGEIKATANEVFIDVQALYYQLVAQTGGLVDRESKLTLALDPGSEVALTATNTYNVNVSDLLKKNFPNLRVVTDVLYGAKSAANPQGVAGGNVVQLIAESIEGQETGYCAYNEKMRAHPMIRLESAFRKKVTAGTWGAVIRMPMGVAQMIGV